jgi:hypothetical protein
VGILPTLRGVWIDYYNNPDFRARLFFRLLSTRIDLTAKEVALSWLFAYNGRGRLVETSSTLLAPSRREATMKYLTMSVTVMLLTAIVGLAGDEANPVATRSLALARDARAAWQNFPGFTAEVEVNLDGKVTRGRVQVNEKGKVQLEMSDPAAAKWARGLLTSTVEHRMATGAAEQTPCCFVDQDITHPLGRAIRVLNDEMHSSYRIYGDQILEVNRQTKDMRFTIVVMENIRNEEGKYLPASFVVNTWDLKTNALRSSDASHQTWKRVGQFDLPAKFTLVTATSSKLQTRALTLMQPKLADRTAAR